MTFLIHGGYGTGKTHLLGDMLKYERNHAKPGRSKVSFLDIGDERGFGSIQNLGLGDAGEHIKTLKDLHEALDEYTKAGDLAALGVDGFNGVGQLIIAAVCGDRLPKVGNNSDDWQRIHYEFTKLYAKLRPVAPVVMCSSASDRSMDQVSGQMSLTPDLPGRQAAGVAGKFDFVFTLSAMVTGLTSVKRTLHTAPMANTVIRARTPRPLPTSIDLVAGEGSWAKVRGEIEKAFF
jgi:hypothetical protein